jgi:hypothetical protein
VRVFFEKLCFSEFSFGVSGHLRKMPSGFLEFYFIFQTAMSRTQKSTESEDTTAFSDWYIDGEYKKIHLWTKTLPPNGLSTIQDLLNEDIPVKSDRKYNGIQMRRILYRSRPGWKLAKLFFCSKKQNDPTSRLGCIPLEIFKLIFEYTLDNREDLVAFSEITSDFNLYTPLMRQVFPCDKYTLSKILRDPGIKLELKEILLANAPIAAQSLFVDQSILNIVDIDVKDFLINAPLYRERLTNQRKQQTSEPASKKLKIDHEPCVEIFYDPYFQ